MTTPNPIHRPIANTTAPGYSSDHLEDNRRAIAAYRSRRAGDRWDAIAPFVRASANRLADESKDMLKVSLGMLSQFALWAYERGLPLDDPKDILIPANLTRFASERMGNYSPSTYQVRLNHLRRLLKQIGEPDAAYPRNPVTQDYFAGRTIYSEQDQAAFIASRHNRKTERQRTNFSVYIGLGFGAGLTSQELNDVRTSDITTVNGRWVVQTRGAKPRTVPIRHDWSRYVVEGISTRQPDDYAILGWRDPRRPERLPIRISIAAPHQPRPTPSVMRATWIVEHLVRGLRPDVVAELAGMFSVENYLARMPSYDVNDYFAQAAGGEA